MKIQLAQERIHLHTKVHSPETEPSFRVARPQFDSAPPEISKEQERRVLSHNTRREKVFLETIKDSEESK